MNAIIEKLEAKSFRWKSFNGGLIPIIELSDAIAICKEETCPDCNGTGEIDIIDQSKVHSQSIDIPYKKDKCEICKGEGRIILIPEE